MMVDVICFDDLDPLGRDIDDPLLELEQDVVHVLRESLGSNLDDVGRGADVEAELSNTTIASVGPRIDAELLKDDRIDASRSTLTASAIDGAFELSIEAQVNGEALGIELEIGPDGNVRKAT